MRGKKWIQHTLDFGDDQCVCDAQEKLNGDDKADAPQALIEQEQRTFEYRNSIGCDDLRSLPILR